MERKLTWEPQELRSRIGISTALFEPQRVDGRMIEMIAESGIRNLELSQWYGRGDEHFDPYDPKEVNQVAEALAGTGVRAVSMHMPYQPDIAGSDEAKRRKAVAEAAFAVEGVLPLGVGVFVDHYLGHTVPAEQSIIELLDSFAGASITFTAENSPGEDLAGIVRMIDNIGSDRVGLTVDVGHSNSAQANPFLDKQSACSEIISVGRYLRHLHLHDCKAVAQGQYQDHNPPFSGAVQWLDLFRGLVAADYEGVFMFEIDQRVDTASGLRSVVEFPDRLLDLATAELDSEGA